MRTFAILAFASVVIAACSFRSETVEQKPAPTATPSVVTSSTSVGIGGSSN
jgi:hypothetical protein